MWTRLTGIAIDVEGTDTSHENVQRREKEKEKEKEKETKDKERARVKEKTQGKDRLTSCAGPVRKQDTGQLTVL